MTGIVLLRCPGMQGDHRESLLLGGKSRLDERDDVVVDADAELARDRNAERLRGLDGGGHDRAREVALHGDGRAAALARHLRGRAAEVHVDVVGDVLLAQCAHGLADELRVAAVDLQAAEVLVLAERDHLLRLLVAVDECGSHDHLTHVDEAGTELPALRAERNVGHARHRREHDGDRELASA